MRAWTVLVVLLLVLPAAAAASTWSGRATGFVAAQEWDVYNFWHNSTGTVDFLVDWRASGLYPAEDLSLTLYKPGVFDRECPPSQGVCDYRQHPDDVQQQSWGCPPLNFGREKMQVKDLPEGRYHVAVEGNLGLGVPYTLSVSAGSVTPNATLVAGVVYVPPC